MQKSKASLKNISNAPDRFPIRPSEFDRFKFGKQSYYEVARLKKEGPPLCLDIACGAKPFPNADVLCDLHANPVPDRRMMELVTGGKPFVSCSCYSLPFKDKAFDFVTTYYLLEHVIYPSILLRELRRVSAHGYVQSPSWLSELLYGEKVHRWAIIKRKNKLYIRALNQGALPPIRFGFIFHRLYKAKTWQILHAIIDEKLHLFTVQFQF